MSNLNISFWGKVFDSVIYHFHIKAEFLFTALFSIEITFTQTVAIQVMESIIPTGSISVSGWMCPISSGNYFIALNYTFIQCYGYLGMREGKFLAEKFYGS